MKLSVKNNQGQDQGEVNVTFDLIEDDKGAQAVHDVVVAYMAAQRSGTACTKTRGEVSGGGKKPWRQKGTGRARAGSTRSPIWRGGGVVFGPRPRDYSKKVTKSVKRLAFRRALSERLKAGDVTVVDSFGIDKPKTKDFVNVINSLELSGSTLVVSKATDDNLALASRNIQKVDVQNSDVLNTYQLLRYDHLVFTREAFESVNNRVAQN